MTRAACISALVGTLGSVSAFQSANNGTCVAYDDRAAASGVNQAVVVRHLRGEEHPRDFQWWWELSADVFIRVNNDVQAARATASVLVDSLIEQVRNNPKLGGSVVDAAPVSNRFVTDQLRAFRGVYYVEQITYRLKEEV